VATPLAELGKADRSSLIGVEQAFVSAGDPIQAGPGTLLGRSLPQRARIDHRREVFELCYEPVGIGKQPGNVVPHSAFDFLGLDATARAGGWARAQNAVLAMALVRATLPL
jgi:hypothetical protein